MPDKAMRFVASAMLVVGTATASFNGEAWTIKDLGPLPGLPAITATSINEFGQVVGYGTGPESRAFLWSSEGGMFEPIPLLPCGVCNDSYAFSINNAGLVSGDLSAQGGIAFVWSATTGVKIIAPLPETNTCSAENTRMNDLSEVVGICCDGACSDFSLWKPFIWRGASGTQPLPMHLQGGRPFAINNRGEVVGYAFFPRPDLAHHAFRWSAGEGLQDLGVLAGMTNSRAYAINDSGTIVGASSGLLVKPFIWSAHSGMVGLTLSPPVGGGYALDINSVGDVVGVGSAGVERALLWHGGAMIDLGTLQEVIDAGWSSLRVASGINDGGQIAGWGIHAGEPRAYLLSPGGPAPSAKTAGPCPPAGQGAGDDPNRPADCPLGNPVNPATGNKYQIETDYITAGVYPLRFERFYNSIAGYGGGTLGVQWRHTFDRSVRRVGTTAVLYRQDGKAYVFNLNGAEWVGPPDVMDALVQTQHGWTYTTAPDDEVEIYSADGRLESIANRAGIAHVLGYDGTKRLVKVTHSVTGAVLLFSYDGSARLAAMSDPAGQTYAYTYDGGRLSTVTYPDDTLSTTDNPVRTYVYNEPEHTSSTNLPHWLTGIIDENGIRFATYKYDSHGRAVSTEHAGGTAKYSVSYATDGTSTVSDPLNTLRTYSFQTHHEVPRTSALDKPCNYCGLASAISYDTDGLLASATNFNGFTTSYVHSRRGLEETRTEGAGTPQARAITTQWHPTFRLPVAIAEPKRITSYQYDATTGRVLSKTVQATTDPDGLAGFSATPVGVSRAWSYSYEPAGAAGPIQSMTEDGPRTDATPDDVTTWQFYPSNHACTPSAADGSTVGCRGQLWKITNALGHKTEITRYSVHGRVEQFIDPNGLIATLAYDARQRLTSRDVGGELTQYEYWPTGLLKQITLPDQTFLAFAYDDAHRLTAVSDSVGNKIVYTLDAMGNRIAESATDPDGQLATTRARIYDALNRLAQDLGGTNPATQVSQYSYDAQGNLTGITEPLSRVTRLAYDALNRLVAVTDPGAAVTRFGYDPLDRLASVTDPRGLSTTYQRDGLDNLARHTSPDSGTTHHAYDEAGNLLSSTDARGVVATYSYDALNRLARAVFTPPAASTLPNIARAYEYDRGANGIGRLTRINDSTGTTVFDYDAHGRLAQDTRRIAGVPYTSAYHYDGAGRLIGITYPSGRHVGYTLDSGGRISAISTTYGGATQLVVAAVTYRPFGGVQSFVFGNGQFYVRTFDLDGRISGYTLGDRSQTLTWDAANRVTVLSDPANPGKPTLMGYDKLNRLVSFLTPSSSQSFTYDAVGNRLSQGIGAHTYSYGYAASSNRLLNVAGPAASSYAYDAAGNPATSGKHIYVYDARGRLSQVIGAGSGALLAQYRFNASGQRVQKAIPGAVERTFQYDAQGHLIAESLGSGATVREYLWLGNQPIAMLTSDRDGDGVLDAVDDCILEYNPDQSDASGEGFGNLCDGDANGDGVLSQADVDLMLRIISGLAPADRATVARAEVTGNGVLNVLDLTQLVRQLMRGRVAPGPSGLRGQWAGPELLFVHTDHLDTPRLLSDRAGQEVWRWDLVDPFGANVATENPVQNGVSAMYQRVRFDLRLPGQYFDKETGLHYNYYRDYDPQTGRYLQSDPIGLGGGPNTYGYVSANPVSRSDPLGLDWIDSLKSWWSGSVAAFQADSASDTAWRILQALPADSAMLAGLGLIKRLGTAERCVATEASIVANAARGRAVEARVLEELGLAKNTKAVSTAEGRSIPDALTDSLSVEIKDALNVSLTRQLRIQTEAAREAERASVLITGEKTCVSGACSRAFDTIIRRPDLGP